MRGYAQSKIRLLFLTMLVGFVLALLARSAIAQTGPQTPAAAGAPAKISKPTVLTLIMDNQDPVFFTILGLSIVGLTLIIQGVMENRSSVFLPRQSTDTIRELIAQRKFQELLDFTENDPTFISQALNPALKRAPSFSSMKEAMETAIGEQTAEQFRKIEYLNIIGNLGPLLGLLGTVLGMIDAFSAMQAQGGATTPAALAGGVAKALCHTLLGLTLAVPCLAAFGVLRTVVDRLTVRGALIAEELLLMIKPGEARPAPPTGRQTQFPTQSYSPGPPYSPAQPPPGTPQGIASPPLVNAPRYPGADI